MGAGAPGFLRCRLSPPFKHCSDLSLTHCLLFNRNTIHLNSVPADGDSLPTPPPSCEEEAVVLYLDTTHPQSLKSDFIVCYQAFLSSGAFKVINGSLRCCVPFSALLLLYFIGV